MRIEWMVLAEGVAQDARGAFTLVGLNQNIFSSDSLPATTKRALFVKVADVADGEEIAFRAAVTSPDGRVLSAQQGQLTVQARAIPGIPSGGIDIPMEFVIGVREHGTHTISFEISDPATGTGVESAVELFVVSPGVMRAV